MKSFAPKVSAWEIFLALKDQKHPFFLDSSLPQYPRGRFSFFGADPFYTYSSDNNPLPGLAKLFAKYRLSQDKTTLPFLGGAVGYLGYNVGFSLEEKVKQSHKSESGIPGSFFGFYNCVIIFDHLKRRAWIFATGLPEKNSRAGRLLCAENIRKTFRLFSDIGSKYRPLGQKTPISSAEKLKSSFSREKYIAAVRKVLEYIRAGDIYQVNLSQRFWAETALSAAQIYGRLREISGACFNAYFDAGSLQVLSASPERFLQVERGWVTTRPMKGTRRRSPDPAVDLKLKKGLLASSKEKAELLMIVDLERNDLGRVCRPGSIRVLTTRELEEYPGVFQATATVRGRLRDDQDRFSALAACFPGGSITGCPKIRAMQIIEELEPVGRCLYTGALGYISFSGGMDFNILIRTIVKKGKEVSFSAGGGIVADSRPEDEYRETLIKARGMCQALGIALEP